MVNPREYVAAPTAALPGYGLLSVARVINSAGDGDRWEAGGVEFQSDNDQNTHGGKAFTLGCAASYSVTLTKTANASEYSVTFDPAAGSYQLQVDNTGWIDAANGGTFTVFSANSTVDVREKAGLRRGVSITGVSNAAAAGTVKTATSSLVPDPQITGAGRPVTEATPFGVFGAVNCQSLGLTGQAAADIAARRLALGEARTVEATYEDGSQGNTPRLADPATVQPAGATGVGLLKALSALEAYLRSEYSGTGTIHMPAALAPYMAWRKQMRPDGAVMRTALGTPIAFGGGYRGLSPVDGAAPAEDEAWIYATGQLEVRRSRVFVPALGAEALDRRTNLITVVAERHYLVSHDSLTPAAVHVDLALEA